MLLILFCNFWNNPFQDNVTFLCLPKTQDNQRFSDVYKDKKKIPYNHTTCIPSWNDLETTVSMSLQRGIHVVCL